MDPQSQPADDWIPLAPEAGRLLVATPMLTDKSFRRTVVYLHVHGIFGSEGMILTRPSRTPVGQVLPSWHDHMSEPDLLFVGGPVEIDQVYCLAELTDFGDDVQRFVDDIGTVDVKGDPEALAKRTGRMRMFAGHCGWGPGQLEEEIRAGAWFVVEGGPDDLFTDEPRTLWQRVLRRQPPPLSLVSTYPSDSDPALN